MTPWRLYHLALMLCVTATLVLVAAKLTPVDSATLLPPSQLESSLLAHCFHNAFSSWPTWFLPLKLGDSHLPALAIATLTFGLAVLAQILYPMRSPISITLVSTSSVALVLLIFGVNHMLITGCAFAPWLAASLLLHRRSPSSFSTVICCASAAALALNAHQITVPLVAGCAAIASVSGTKRPKQALDTFVAALMIVAALIALNTTPYPEMPPYPYGSRVVADDSIAGDPRPHVGREYPLRPVDRSVIHERYQALAIASTIVSGIAWWAVPASRGLAGLAIGLGSLATLDTVPAEIFAQISPLQTIARVIPGGILIPFIDLSLFLSTILIVLALLAASWRIRALGVVVIGLSAACVVQDETLSVKPTLPLLSEPGGCNALTRGELSAAKLMNPSFAIINRYGAFVTDPFPEIPAVPAEKFKLTFVASNHSELFPMLVDNSRETRWTSGNGRQAGDEWLLIQSDQPLELAGLQLHIGPFFTDYPRGLKISLAERCAEGRRSMFDRVFLEPRWRGAIRQLADGTPLFDTEQVVRARWPLRQNVHCVLIEQIGGTPRFDWSITGIDLLTPTTPEAP